MPSAPNEPPLAELRVLDVSTGDAARVGRLLADLGADVVNVASPEQAQRSGPGPRVGGISVANLLDNANKRRLHLDPDDAEDRRTFLELARESDIVIDSGIPGRTAAFGVGAAELADRFDHLTVLSVSDFGRHGPRSGWRASDPVLYALSSVLSRSGKPGAPPVLPPQGIASATAAAQAAWAVLVAYYQRLRTGRGEFVDFSRYEAVLQALDPPFGAQGQAAAARGMATAHRGRPKRQDSYPIFACRDGYVRICLLAPRQWRAMRRWLGEPAAFQDPEYDHIAVRAAASDEIGAAISALFAEHDTAELVEEGSNRGVPVAAVLRPRDIRFNEHFRDRGAWTEIALSPDIALEVPDGPIVIDGKRSGIQAVERSIASGSPVWSAHRSVSPPATPSDRPFEGLRILDLGVIVAGGELGRLFADLGADVVKVESPTYPDGLRQARKGQAMSESFAWTHRNQSALGLDLRSPGGAALFSGLIREADAVFANFKPGTLAALGFSYDAMTQINPRVVLAESSAYGDTGPWSARMGYGPLVRASTGITRLWTAESAHPDGQNPFCDSVTVFPDHIVARLAAVATLAALIRRRRSQRGAHIHISQAETAISGLDVAYSVEWAEAAGLPVTADLALHLVSPCDGDDEWCVISIDAHNDWHAVASALGRPDLIDDARFSTAPARWQSRDEIRSLLADFTRRLSPHTVADLLQQRGVAAAPMNRGSDVLEDPQVLARALYSEMTHPLLDVTLPTETHPALYQRIPSADLRPAPVLGEHTRDVCKRWLTLDDNEIDHLIDQRALFSSTKQAPTPEESTA